MLGCFSTPPPFPSFSARPFPKSPCHLLRLMITLSYRIQASQVVVAAGAWSGHLLADSLGEQVWRTALQPRKGHLLEVQPSGLPAIRHGLMEVGYTSVSSFFPLCKAFLHFFTFLLLAVCHRVIAGIPIPSQWEWACLQNLGDRGMHLQKRLG